MAVEELFSGLPNPWSPFQNVDAPFYTQPEHLSPVGFEGDALLQRAYSLIAESLEVIKINNLKEQAEAIIDIATIKVILREDPSELITQAIELSPGNISGTDLILYGASLVAAYSGDFERSFTLAQESIRKNEGPWPLRSTARVVHALGGDTQPFLDSIETLLELKTNRNIKQFPGLLAVSYASTAELMVYLGKDPIQYLEKASEILANASEDSFWAYESLADAYAYSGQIDQAKILIGKIKLNDPDRTGELKQAALQSIAYQQARQGNFGEAFTAAKESDLYNVTARIHLAKAFSEVSAGNDPQEHLDKAVVEIAAEDPGPEWRNKGYRMAVVYSEVGRILTLAGKNPDEAFKAAFDIANSLESNKKKAQCLAEIAPNISIGGGSAKRFIEAALALHKRSGLLDDLFDIYEGALESGLPEIAETILDRVKNMKEEYEKEWLPAFLIKGAQVYARWAVSQLTTA